MRGIEPPLPAWEADVLPLNYIREDATVSGSVASARQRRRLPIRRLILSDRTIRENWPPVIVIDPLDETAIQPSSVDLRFAAFALPPPQTPTIARKLIVDEPIRRVETEDGAALVLRPGELSGIDARRVRCRTISSRG